MKLIYCDESCHLPNDEFDIMVLGGIICSEENKNRIHKDIRDIKEIHEISSFTEVKWTKVSQNKIDLYKDLIEYFFDNDDLEFRAVVTLEKKSLNHNRFNEGSFDKWYYKMYFYLLSWFISPDNKYRIFLDKKDTLGGPRVKKLHDVLCYNEYDFKRDVIIDVQQVDSKNNDIMQLADILIGAVSYYHRQLHQNSNAKTELVKLIQVRTNNSIDGTRPYQRKFNIFKWNPRRF